MNEFRHWLKGQLSISPIHKAAIKDKSIRAGQSAKPFLALETICQPGKVGELFHRFESNPVYSLRIEQIVSKYAEAADFKAARTFSLPL